MQITATEMYNIRPRASPTLTIHDKPHIRKTQNELYTSKRIHVSDSDLCTETNQRKKTTT